MTRWLPALFIVSFACTSDPATTADVGFGPVLCDPAVPCPGPLICVSGFCVSPAPDATAGEPDALPASDVGPTGEDAAADAGVEDAAPADDAAPTADDAAPGPQDAAPTAEDAAPGPQDAAPGPQDAAPADATPLADAGVPDAAPGRDATPGDAATGSATDAGNLCRGAADCIPGAEICGRVTVENNRVVTRCGPPVAGGAPVGGMCTADGQCGTSMCLDGITNECTNVCQSAGADCPAGFACVGYTYNPGNVTVPVCNRGCADDDDCTTANTLCSVQSYQGTTGAWAAATVCQLATGSVPLGGACTSPNDCRSGICSTARRLGVGCAACTGGEVCVGNDCQLQACTAICDDASDCANGGPFTRCAPGLNFGLPDGTVFGVSGCQRP